MALARQPQAYDCHTLETAVARCHGPLERVAGQMHQAFATLLDEPPPDVLLGELEEARRPRSN